jgi:hypothetical protein
VAALQLARRDNCQELLLLLLLVAVLGCRSCGLEVLGGAGCSTRHLHTDTCKDDMQCELNSLACPETMLIQQDIHEMLQACSSGEFTACHGISACNAYSMH